MKLANINSGIELIDSSVAWKKLLVALLISTVGGIGLWSTVVVMPTIELEFGLDRSDASIPYTATMIGFAIGGVIMGRFVDRYGIFFPVIISSFVLGLGYFLASLTMSFVQFSLVQALLIGMFGCSVTLGPLIAYTSFWFRKKFYPYCKSEKSRHYQNYVDLTTYYTKIELIN